MNLNMCEQEKFDIKVGFGTDRGLVREINEDSFCVFVPYPGSENASGFQAVLGVADGMGGHRAGDLASHFITDKINDAFIQRKYREKFEHLNDFLLILKNVIREINLELYSVSKRDKTLYEIGSTLTLGTIKDSILYLAHVGDSRCYWVRGGEIKQLTKDHSWIAEQVNSGLLSREEALNHPKQNILTQAIGFDPNIEPQMLTRKVKIGDKYVFCSDGLTHYVSDNEIMDIINKNSHPQRACDSLIALAKQRGGEDNITAVLGYVNETLTETKEETVDLPSPEEKKELLMRYGKKILFGILILFLAFSLFFLGTWYQRSQVAKRVEQLFVQGENYYRAGEYEKAIIMIESVLEIDKKNKKALGFLEKYKKKNLR